MLFTFEQGSPVNPPIVLLHGGGLSHKAWRPILDRLPDFYCLAPDLPGHGRSRHMRFSLVGAANAVAELILAKTPHGRAHLVAHSLSGAVVLTLLRLYPDVADHIILCGSSGQLPNWLVQMSLPMFGLLKWINPETLVHSTLRQQGIPSQYDADLFDDVVASSDPQFLRPMYTELVTLDVPKAIHCPLLVCVGEKEPGAAKLYGQISLRPLKQYPSARGAVMPNGGHVWALQFPDVFADMVRAWVTDAPLPAAMRQLIR